MMFSQPQRLAGRSSRDVGARSAGWLGGLCWLNVVRGLSHGATTTTAGPVCCVLRARTELDAGRGVIRSEGRQGR